MPRKSISPYPDNWNEIAKHIKDDAGWKCVRCGHPHDPKAGYCLTVHHLDMNPQNNKFWNTPAVCQRCHLIIQSKVVMERPYMFSHTAWFRPYVAGYYAFRHGLPDNKEYVMEHMDELLKLWSK